MPRRLHLSESLTPEQLAKLARLSYVCDQDAGLSRQQNGSGFHYFNTKGESLRDERQLRRIEMLVIPPAWRDVWICRIARGHLQATGRDARKRKQYLYHERWQHISNLAKFSRLEQFGRLLPKLRQTVARDLAGKALSRQRVLAGMVALLDLTGIRVGYEEYVKENNSYGLTTLRNRHVAITSEGVQLRFRAKGGIQREVLVKDKLLERLFAECIKVKGSHAFQYLDEVGRIRQVSASDVNEYLKELTGEPFTAKDFRTWKASAQAAGRLRAAAAQETVARRKKLARSVVSEAAELLSNTPSVCRNYYIHPGLLECYEGASFDGYFQGFRTRRRPDLTCDEQALLRFLRRWKPPAD